MRSARKPWRPWYEDNLKTHVECFRAFVHQDVDKALEYAAKIPNKLNRLRLVYKLKQWAGRDKERLCMPIKNTSQK